MQIFGVSTNLCYLKKKCLLIMLRLRTKRSSFVQGAAPPQALKPVVGGGFSH